MGTAPPETLRRVGGEGGKMLVDKMGEERVVTTASPV